MTLRKMKRNEYAPFVNYLSQTARSKPYCPIYEKDITLDGDSYTLFVQPGRHNYINILYALRTSRTGGDVNYQMIIKDIVLISFLEVLIYMSQNQNLTQEPDQSQSSSLPESAEAAA